jgi:hypothetical protein
MLDTFTTPSGVPAGIGADTGTTAVARSVWIFLYMTSCARFAARPEPTTR